MNLKKPRDSAFGKFKNSVFGKNEKNKVAIETWIADSNGTDSLSGN